MPRKARTDNQNGIYHIMFRGNNRQQIFYDTMDFRYYESLLQKYKKKCGYELYAYCLMGNHIHLLINAKEDPFSIIFRKIGSSFVYWYNMKYDRVGHLFQDRYRSEPIKDASHFITVLRYILQNPVKAGLCTTLTDYNYSSGREYILGTNGITDLDFAMTLFRKEDLVHFLLQPNNDQCLDIVETRDSISPRKCTDEIAKSLILDELGTFSPIIGKPKERRSLFVSIRKLHSYGISIRQLSRLTGISKKIIEQALKK